VFGGAMVLALGMSGVLAAQTGTAQQPPATSGHSMEAQPVTVEGCLVREQAVPGREPNVAERAGVMEDYILTSVKFVKGSPHASATGTSGATGATGTAAGETAGTSGIKADAKLEVRGIDDEQLKQFVGQRVQIEGKLDPKDFAERAREKASASGEKSGDLPELNGTVIRKSSSTDPCPSK
jgi:hypothetical protein